MADVSRVRLNPALLRRWVPAVAAAVGISLSVLGFSAIRQREQERLRADFAREADERAHALSAAVGHGLYELAALGAFYAATQDVTRQEFAEFVKPALAHDPSIKALEWIPRVPDSLRTRFEREARKDGFPGFKFTERRSRGKMVRAGRRGEYFPVYYVEPYAGNEAALGFDLASNPVRLDAIERARSSGEMAATARITLVQETGASYGFLVFLPVYDKGDSPTSAGQRRNSLKGFALAVYRIRDLVSAALVQTDSAAFDVSLFDLAAPDTEQLLVSRTGSRTALPPSISGQAAARQAGPHFVRRFDVAGRRWMVLCTPTAAYLAGYASSAALAFLVLGLLFTAAVVAYLLNAAGRHEQVERLVATRTKELRQAQDELVKNERLAVLGQVAGCVAHEIRNPLAAIRNAAYYIKMTSADSLQGRPARHLEIVDEQITQANEVITSLLEFVHLGTPEPYLCSVAELLEAAVCGARLPEGVEVIRELPESLPYVNVDRAQIVHAFEKLLTNAWQAMRGQGVIGIGGSLAKGRVRVTVVDNGPGIPPERLPRLFEPLYSTKSFGVGLGLPLCKSLVEANNGTIEVLSKPGKGVTVVVTLPALPAVTEPAEATRQWRDTRPALGYA